ncbi:MAG: hypothetical protein HC923_12440 [Myxococcales bacterium]|nr:hypothetical protein [Myxococcales bacterium]
MTRAKEAIRLNPHESFYRQTLAGYTLDRALRFREAAVEAEERGDSNKARELLAVSDDAAEETRSILLSALRHAWAPENIFITEFQLHYQLGRMDKARRALERALDHSPHLGAIRAQLAILEEQQGDLLHAYRDCQWAIEADAKSAVGHRVCGRILLERGDKKAAERHLRRAKKLAPNDPLVDRLLQAATATS